MSNNVKIMGIARHLEERGLEMTAITAEAADSGQFMVVAENQKECEFAVWGVAIDGVRVDTYQGNYFRYHDPEVAPFIAWTRNEAKVMAIRRMTERAGIVPTP